MKKNNILLTGIFSISLIFGLLLTACPTDDSNNSGSGNKQLYAVWYFDTNKNGIVDEGEGIAYEFKSDGTLLVGGNDSGDTFSVSGNKITYIANGYPASASAAFEINGNSLSLTSSALAIFQSGKYAKKDSGGI